VLPVSLLSLCFQFCSHQQVASICSRVNKHWTSSTKKGQQMYETSRK
jgi:hypothetical protein